jgi:predicted methyltransferase
MKYLLMTTLILLSGTVLAGDYDVVEEKLTVAMNSDIRTQAEKDRDSNRLPIETLEFFGLRDDMTIVELIPGGGWYTKLLYPVVKDNGKYYAAYGTKTVAEKLFTQPGFEAAVVLDADVKTNPALGVNDVDMVLTFRNYHNFDHDGRAAIDKAAFDALKSGGVYAVVDHTRRHMEPDNAENGRRVDPVMAIKEIQAAGFVFVDYSTLHYRPVDGLIYEVGNESVTGQTDRFTLKFVKP